MKVKSSAQYHIPDATPKAFSQFNLSHEKKFTADMGLLYPHCLHEACPGDTFDLGVSAIVRFQPLLAPVLHSVRMKTYYFFVPYRILWDQWEEFITRGEDGESVIALPVWDPAGVAAVYAKGTLWDMLGFPLLNPPAEACPLDFPRRAYYRIWNEFFRDQNLQTEVAETGYELQRVNWDREYISNVLPWQQRGISPALPAQSILASFPWAISGVDANADEGHYPGVRNVSGTLVKFQDYWTNKATNTQGGNAPGSSVEAMHDTEWSKVFETVSAGDIADLRLLVQAQVWMERNARAGVRYTEFLNSHFGVSPRDDRLQRPEYIGGTKDDVIFSEVLQTGEAGTTPQGNMAGHGISVQSGRVGRYRVEEFGLIMGLTAITPKPSYQDGLHRSWLRRTTFDFMFPEFASLSEQEVFNAEVCLRPESADPNGVVNLDLFGFQGRYDELRSHNSIVCGDMRDTYDYWHMGRQFNPASPPVLDGDFVKCNPRKDFLAVPSEPAMIVAVGNHVRVMRRLPLKSVPGGLFR